VKRNKGSQQSVFKTNKKKKGSTVGAENDVGEKRLLMRKRDKKDLPSKRWKEREVVDRAQITKGKKISSRGGT